ncbi:MAG: LemA family protein [Bacteriovoracaceae bacterium]
MEVVLGVVAFILIVYFLIYNSLVAKKNAVEHAFSSIDVQLKQRFDLLPNLVETVKQFMGHEKSVLEGVTKLRTQAQNSTTADQKIGVSNELSKLAGQIMVISENYPDLKSNTNFLQLQQVMNETESQIAAARRAFNAAVIDLNNAIEMFPTSLIAGTMKLQRRSVLATEEGERKNPQMKELFK